MIGGCHARKNMCFFKKFWWPDTVRSHLFTPTGRGFHTWLPLKTRQQLPLLAPLFLNAGFAEVDFHRQRPGLLALLWLLHGDGDHRAQVEGVDFVGVIQELFVSVDAQLTKTQTGGAKWGAHADACSTNACVYRCAAVRPTCVLMCCSGAVTRLAQLSHSMTMMDRKRQAAKIQRGRPERLERGQEEELGETRDGQKNKETTY